MKDLTKINDNIYRLTLPYYVIYTTVFFIKTEEGVIIFDTASGESDVENAILPALKELMIPLENVKFVFVSHNHRDHAGGLERLMQVVPCATIITGNDKLKKKFAAYDIMTVSDNDEIAKGIRVVSIPGHTADCTALFDTRTKTLITGDCLQVYGIPGPEEWACNITLIPQHLEALNKVRSMDIDEIYAAHDYYPTGYRAVGKKEIDEMIDGCKNALVDIKIIIESHPDADDEAVRALFNQSVNLPNVSIPVVAAVRYAVKKGDI